MLLREQGCYKESDAKRHERWYSPKTGRYFPVGRHDREEVPPGTLNSILKDAGLR